MMGGIQKLAVGQGPSQQPAGVGNRVVELGEKGRDY